METICLDAKKSNMCGASIGSDGKGFSVFGGCSEATGWRFESVPLPCDVPRQWTSSAGILTRISFAQS